MTQTLLLGEQVVIVLHIMVMQRSYSEIFIDDNNIAYAVQYNDDY